MEQQEIESDEGLSEQDKIVKTKRISDNRVHILLFFFDKHRINEMDLNLVKKFEKFTSVIPILAKGDQFEAREMNEVKLDLITKASDRNIKFYDCKQAIENICPDSS
jgi:septin family protein